MGFFVPGHLSWPVDRGHLGLMSMCEWAAEAGCIRQIESAAGQGTRVRLEVAVLDQT